MTGKNDLTRDQEKYLLEISSFVVCHTSRDSQGYSVAEELKEMGLIRIVGRGFPLKRTILTKSGREYVKGLEAGRKR